MNRRGRLSFLWLMLLFITIIAAACGPARSQPLPLYQTLTPLNASIRSTLTARAGQANSNQDLTTAVANATAEAQLVYGTEAAAPVQANPAQPADSAVTALVAAELSHYGINPGDGSVAQLQLPVTIQLEGNQQTGFTNDFQIVTAADFVMAADITWHTVNSASSCGFLFRSNEDKNQPSQYMVVISRVSSGQLAFLATVNGKIANYHSFYPRDKDKSFSWFNDATNRLAVIARGKIIDVYTNQELIGEIDVTQPPSQTISVPPTPELPAGANNSQVQDFNNQLNQSGANMNSANDMLSQAQQNFSSSNAVLTDGFLGFVGLNQSGSMTCKFSNGWLFNLVK